MKQAMNQLGYRKDDLNTKKRRENFQEDMIESSRSPRGTKPPVFDIRQLSTIEPEDVDDALVSMRFKHYQQRLMDRINRVL